MASINTTSDIVPVKRADEPLIAEAQLLPVSQAQVSLVQIERIGLRVRTQFITV